LVQNAKRRAKSKYGEVGLKPSDRVGRLFVVTQREQKKKPSLGEILSN